MINIGKHCCGCSACVQKCPKHCIRMEEDSEGFLYPVVNKDLCIDCDLCKKVCPVLAEKKSNLPLDTFACINQDEEVRLMSSSGGIFSLIAEAVYAEGGVVCGACFDEKWNVFHKTSETLSDLEKFRGSKYVQSKIGETFKVTESFLKAGRKVLYSGTPCQIAGLKRYLRSEYENLITVDFVCHGVPSAGVFRWYLQEEINKIIAQKGNKNSASLSTIHSIPKGDVLIPNNWSIKDIRFRDKRKGWKKYSFALDLAEVSADGKQNTVSLSYILNENKFLDGFFNDLYLRPCCYECPFKEYNSYSDITIGDFWNIGTHNRKWDDDKGVSCLLCNSEKGLSVIDCIDVERLKVELKIIELRNPAILRPAKLDVIKRDAFFAIQDKGFMERVQALCKPTLRRRLYKNAYNILETIGVMKIIHLIKYHNR